MSVRHLITAALIGLGLPASQENPAADVKPLRLPAGLVAAEGASTDAATGLPTRVVQETSGITLVLIPAGEFSMGSSSSTPDHARSERQHRRVIRTPFYLGEKEVTTAQFRRFVEATHYQTDAERGVADGVDGRGAFAAMPHGDREWNESASWRNPFPNLPDHSAADDHPVIHVSWNDARQFCAHYGLSLPSEAQWEYACRAGSTTRFPWGDAEAQGDGYANVADASGRRLFPAFNVLFPFDDGVAVLAPVGSYRPNAWQLHDMIGNVEEWCEDAWGEYPPDGADESPAVHDDTLARLLRGSCWLGNPFLCRSAHRAGMRVSSRRDFIGFRVALKPTRR